MSSQFMSGSQDVNALDLETNQAVAASPKCVLIVDADNTLWDTNEVFARAQLRLLEGTERAAGRMCPATDRLEFVRSYDQAIAVKHHLHLKYPAQLLVAAVGAGLCGTDPAIAAEFVIGGRPLPHRLSEPQVCDVLAAYTHTLTETPALLPTVREALELARSRDMAVFVVTEGKLERQRRLLTEHGLAQLVVNAWEMPKTAAQFERLRQRFTQAEVVVIGDQLDRDIVPAHRAGCRTVFVPGRFKPRWDDKDSGAADHVASTLLEAVQWAAKR
jgi:putative hydrolase of the HAD superfamily